MSARRSRYSIVDSITGLELAANVSYWPCGELWTAQLTGPCIPSDVAGESLAGLAERVETAHDTPGYRDAERASEPGLCVDCGRWGFGTAEGDCIECRSASSVVTRSRIRAMASRGAQQAIWHEGRAKIDAKTLTVARISGRGDAHQWCVYVRGELVARGNAESYEVACRRAEATGRALGDLDHDLIVEEALAGENEDASCATIGGRCECGDCNDAPSPSPPGWLAAALEEFKGQV